MKHFAFVDPHLDTDAAVGGGSLGKAVVDVGSDGLKRDRAFLIGLGTGDFSAAQTAAALNLDAAGAEAHGGADGLLDRTTEGDSLFQLLRDLLGHELSVQVGLLDLDDVDEDGFVAAQHLLAGGLDLLDLRAAFTDDHTGLGAVDVDADPLGVALDLDLGDACGRQRLEQILANLIIRYQRVAEGGLIGIPAGFPVFDDTDSQTGRIDFLSHS